MFGAMTSLTGGGGFSASGGPATSGSSTGDQRSAIGFQGGSVNFAPQGLAAINWPMIIVGVLGVAWLMTRKK